MNVSRPVFLLLLVVSITGASRAQNIGLGNTNPLGPLSFPNSSGNKIVLWGPNPALNHYGIGYQNGQLQFYSDESFTMVSLGVGTSSAYGELLRIKGDGKVGIYNTDPQQILDVGGRVRVNGYDSTTDAVYNTKTYIQPRVFFNNTNNSAAALSIGGRSVYDLFSGSYTGSYFGVYDGNNVLRLGTNYSAALFINGSAGEAGQILRSRDYNGAAGWQNTIAADIYSNSWNAQCYDAANVTATPVNLRFDNGYYDLNHNTFTVDQLSKMVVKFDLAVSALSCVACGPSTFDIQVLGGTTVYRTFRYSMPNGTKQSFTGSAVLQLAPGTYQMQLRATLVSGPPGSITWIDPYVAGHMSVNVIPQQ
jgi:hypothetical protein